MTKLHRRHPQGDAPSTIARVRHHAVHAGLLAAPRYRKIPRTNVWTVSIPLRPGEAPPPPGTVVTVRREKDGREVEVTLSVVIHHYKERVEMAFDERGEKYAGVLRRRRAARAGGEKPLKPEVRSRPEGLVIHHVTRPFRVGEVRPYALSEEDREDLVESQGVEAIRSRVSSAGLISVYVVVVHAEQETGGGYAAVVRLATREEIWP